MWDGPTDETKMPINDIQRTMIGSADPGSAAEESSVDSAMDPASIRSRSAAAAARLDDVPGGSAAAGAAMPSPGQLLVPPRWLRNLGTASWLAAGTL